MLDAVLPLLASSMNYPSHLNQSINSYWFSETSNVFDRVSDQAKDSHEWEWRSLLQNELIAEVSSLRPCQVVVIEVESFPNESVHASRLLDAATLRIDSILKLGNYPIVVCLGDYLPSERVVEWMRMGIDSYTEITNEPSAIADVIHSAALRAAAKLGRYLRFQRLDNMWKSIKAEELSVVEMIFEGLPNKTIATRLKVSQRTVEARRHRIFEKFESRSLPVVIRRICEWKHLQGEFGNPL